MTTVSFYSAEIARIDSNFFIGMEMAFRFDLAIFSARGIDEEGVYEARVSQARVKKNFMKKSKQTLLLMDDSKFNSSHFFKIGDFKNYDAIITNKKTNAPYLKIAKENDIELLW